MKPQCVWGWGWVPWGCGAGCPARTWSRATRGRFWEKPLHHPARKSGVVGAGVAEGGGVREGGVLVNFASSPSPIWD